MATEKKTLSFDDLRQRVMAKAARGGNNPDAAEDIKDPHDAGTKSIPTDKDNKNSTKSLPDNKKNDTEDPEALTHGDTTEAGDGKTPNVSKTENKGGCGEDVTKAASALLEKLNIKKKASPDAEKAPVEEAKKESPEANAEEKKEASEEKKAEEKKEAAETKAEKVELGADAHIKLAQAILEDEENYAVADRMLKRKMGADAAQDLLKAAAESSAIAKEQREQAQFIEYMNKHASEDEKAQFQAAVMLAEFEKSASAEEKEKFQKIASAYQAGLEKCASDLEKKAFEAGAQDAALGMEAGMEAAPAEGEMPGGEMGVEDLMALIMAAVESGEIPPEVAEQLLMALEAEAGGGAPAEGGDPAAEGAPAEEAAPEEKMASLSDKLAKKLEKKED
jgi:hypothetical protein